MSGMQVQEKKTVTLGSLWRDKKSRGVIMQIIAVIGILLFLGNIVSNTVENLDRLGVKVGFDFLTEPANYDINQTLIEYDSSDSHFRAGLVGLLNTLLVAACGIVVATILGFTAGVLRLSHNFVLNRLMQVYVEITRNVPVLLQILLWHGIIIHSLPVPKKAEAIMDVVFATNRGVFLPQPIPQEGFGWVWIALLVAIVFAVLFKRYANKVQVETGKLIPAIWIGAAAIVGLPLIVFMLLGAPVEMSYPALKGFNFKGGFVIKPEFMALWFALSLYTGAFIAEIVRAGIQSVSHGQTEAAHALGIRPNFTMRLVVIPQAMRVIIPPLISQYLNLTKNSSLAIAIGYMDLVATIGGISLNQTGRALESMGIVLGIYLFISLFISALMNLYNKRVALVSR
ncbi:amino acid ABC transporter permease ['Osedax' symbiont bacterium Rs2_46_30_T18]|nr:amino acid ABC transporter permease ['Osedax' symbiont bacterium Rs2_46_30_T18]